MCSVTVCRGCNSIIPTDSMEFNVKIMSSVEGADSYSSDKYPPSTVRTEKNLIKPSKFERPKQKYSI